MVHNGEQQRVGDAATGHTTPAIEIMLCVRTGRKLAEMRQNHHHHTVADREEELAAAVAAYGKSKKCGISTSSRTNHKFSTACIFPRALISGR